MQSANANIRVSLTEQAIEDAPAFADPALGADLRFLGVVRETEGDRAISGIRYSAYAPMAERKLHEIVAHFQQVSGAHPLVIVHRTGFVAAGEASIVIALGQPHSAEAFDLLAAYLRRIKQDVPIWKEPVYLPSPTASESS